MFKIVDKEGNIHGTETDYGNAAELWMLLEEMLGIKLSIVGV